MKRPGMDWNMTDANQAAQSVPGFMPMNLYHFHPTITSCRILPDGPTIT